MLGFAECWRFLLNFVGNKIHRMVGIGHNEIRGFTKYPECFVSFTFLPAVIFTKDGLINFFRISVEQKFVFIKLTLFFVWTSILVHPTEFEI